MKSLNLLTPLVRISRSSGGSPAVNICSSMVSDVIVSGSGYMAPSLVSFGGDSGCKVVDDETESSISDVLEGVGEVERSGDLLRFLERIFCVIRVSENGRACAVSGLEKSSTVALLAVVISAR